MYKYIEDLGINIISNSIGEAWYDAVSAVLNEGEVTFDEERERKSLQNVRIVIKNPKEHDAVIDKLGNKQNIEDILFLTFHGEQMFDFDVVPSFSSGARSYYQRLKEGRMLEYVIKRLSLIPESKKGVISFIHWDDYKAVLDTPYDDYLPCVDIVQLRLLNTETENVKANVNWFARSLDIFQKGNGNMIAILKMANIMIEEISKNIKKEIQINRLDGFVTDIHIYKETYQDAEKFVREYNKLFK